MSKLTEYLSPRRPWFGAVNRQSTLADAAAGLTNAAIVLPQGVAFATIAGLPPQYGLFTAMIPPVIAAFYGSSRVMVSGPTTAISAVLFASLVQFAPAGTPAYVEMALLLTIMVGLIQLAAGLARLGSLITFVSHSVIVGFTAAAALLIASSQLAPALGLCVEKGGGVIERLLRVAEASGQIDWRAAFLSLSTLVMLIFLSRLGKRLPYYLFALAGGSLVALSIDAAGNGIAMFAPLPSVLPSAVPPGFANVPLADLAPAALAIAFIALLEAVSIGRDFAHRREERYDSNQEIVGQGLSNLIGGFFQCYAGSGSFTRSALNAESGARTPLAAIFAAGFLLVLLILLAPFITFIPVPVMAGTILFVAWRLVDFAEIRHILEARTSDTLVLCLTLISGVVVELEFAIVVGVVTSLFAFLRKSASPLVAVLAPAVVDGRRTLRGARRYNLPQCPQILVLRIEGPIYFASVEAISERFDQIETQYGARALIILYLRGVGSIDLSGADFLIKTIRTARKCGGDVHIVATYKGVLSTLRRTGVLNILGEANLHVSKGQAIAAITGQADPEMCRSCLKRVFNECAKLPCHIGQEGKASNDAPTIPGSVS
ncbi:SulP family inorganic anion transporter [Roseovarius sp.]|uniref:SulP family inorganic anion transporter n=1 Tax=Roseovarius sp. TaxID=1486281 RepID=UPI003A975555